MDKFDPEQQAFLDLSALLKERTDQVVIWVGAGMSANLGLPVWPSFTKKLAEQAREKIATFDEPDRSQQEKRVVAAEEHEDLWLAAEILEEVLGPASWRVAVRRFLTPDPGKDPEVFRRLWRLGVRGAVSLNLDGLLARSFVSGGSHELLSFTGKAASSFAYALRTPRPFVLNLHGLLEDHSSWVLTRKALRALQGSDGYKEFVRALLMARTVLFLGVNVQDDAIADHLDHLRLSSPGAYNHYWLSDRRDSDTDLWAEERGVRVIRYNSDDGHARPLDSFLGRLETFVPSEDAAPPVGEQYRLGLHSRTEFEDLRSLTPEELRQVLNEKASRILESTDADRYSLYEQFCRQFDEEIYRSWYISTEPGRNVLLGNTLKKEIASGGFGTVYEAQSSDGERLAIKLLHQDVRTKPEMLQSFRRGVRSMKILARHEIAGMVPYLSASEIPAFVAMPFVDDPNLKEAVEARYIRSWEDLLRVSVSLAEILRTAHRLPERVLHRDLRPPNVMLDGYWRGGDDWEVVLLDFDLSWHLGAQERSVLFGSTSNGYLAPEQLTRTPSASTRHSAVDSFGLGMTIFFILSGRDPIPAQHRHQNWSESLVEASRSFSEGPVEWRSLPRRFARLVERTTADKQASRWDMTQIATELRRLQRALHRPDTVLSGELLAEEIAARNALAGPYEWDEDRLAARLPLSSGGLIELQSIAADSALQTEISWQNRGDRNRKNVGRWMPQAGKRIEDALQSSHWHLSRRPATSRQELRIAASCNCAEIRGRLPETAALFDDLARELAF